MYAGLVGAYSSVTGTSESGAANALTSSVAASSTIDALMRPTSCAAVLPGRLKLDLHECVDVQQW